MKFKINKRKLLKWTGITLGSLIVLLILLILSLRIPAVQNYVKDKLIVYLEDKIQTDVNLEKVFIAFPNRIILENLHLQGQDVDTLLAVRSFDVGLNMWKLLDSQADFTSIDLKGIRANVVRNPDGTFNFDYILDAFATEEKEEESKPFIISLDKIELQDIGISFIDKQSANDINVFFNHLKTRVKTFDLEENSYALDELNLDGLKLKLHQDFVEEVAINVEETVDSLNQQKPMSIDLNAIKFTNFDVDYGDDNSKTYAKILFKELSAEIDKLDLQNNSFEIDKILLSGARLNADLFLPETSNEENTEDSISSSGSTPKLVLRKLELNDVQAVYNNTAVALTNQGIDFNHLDFSDLNLEVRDFQMEI